MFNTKIKNDIKLLQAEVKNLHAKLNKLLTPVAPVVIPPTKTTSSRRGQKIANRKGRIIGNSEYTSLLAVGRAMIACGQNSISPSLYKIDFTKRIATLTPSASKNVTASGRLKYQVALSYTFGGERQIVNYQ